MLRIAFVLTLLLTVALACSDDAEEEIAEDQAQATAEATDTPDPPGAVIFCPRIGNDSTPIPPTPAPSCEPPDEDVGFDELPRGHITNPPPLPPGTEAVSEYVEFESAGARVRFTFGLPSLGHTPSDVAYSWYTYDGGWRHLQAAVLSAGDDSGMFEGVFDSVPRSLIVLASQ